MYDIPLLRDNITPLNRVIGPTNNSFVRKHKVLRHHIDNAQRRPSCRHIAATPILIIIRCCTIFRFVHYWPMPHFRLNMRKIRSFYCTNIDQNDETVISERFKAVTILRLNRPHKQNAFNRTMLERLAHELHKFEQDDSARVAVIHGIGGNFSSGYDLDELKAVAKDSPHDLEKSLIVSIPIHAKTPMTTSSI